MIEPCSFFAGLFCLVTLLRGVTESVMLCVQTATRRVVASFHRRSDGTSIFSSKGSAQYQ